MTLTLRDHATWQAAQLRERGYPLTEEALISILDRLERFDRASFRPYLVCPRCPTSLDKLAFPPTDWPLVRSEYADDVPRSRRATQGSRRVRRTMEGPYPWTPFAYNYECQCDLYPAPPRDQALYRVSYGIVTLTNAVLEAQEGGLRKFRIDERGHAQRV